MNSISNFLLRVASFLRLVDPKDHLLALPALGVLLGLVVAVVLPGPWSLGLLVAAGGLYSFDRYVKPKDNTEEIKNLRNDLLRVANKVGVKMNVD